MDSLHLWLVNVVLFLVAVWFQISESQVSSLEKLLVLLLQWFPYLPVATSLNSRYVILDLILSVAASSRATLKTFLAHIGEFGLGGRAKCRHGERCGRWERCD